MATRQKPKRYQKDWRKKEVNRAKLKYSKETILEKFVETGPPAEFNVPESLACDTMPPVLIRKEKVLCENSRKKQRIEKVPEKLPAFRIEISEIQEELSSGEEDPVEISLMLQESKRKLEENKRKYEENKRKREDSQLVLQKKEESQLIPQKEQIKYPEELIKTHVSAGNPFAKHISENCTKLFNSIVPSEESYNKVWYYKDPLGRTHGAFSSVEMFNWTAAGYFTSSLMVARNDPSQFYSLKMFISVSI